MGFGSLELAWASIWAVVLAGVLAGEPETAGKHAHVGLAIVALVWIGMVAAISFMEAWVKFRAPLLTKAVALDVGYHVFAALNSVEMVHCLALLLLTNYPFMEPIFAVQKPAPIDPQALSDTWQRLAVAERQVLVGCWALAGILIFEIIVIKPKLDLAARHVIAASNAKADIAPSRMAAYTKFTESLKGAGPKPPKYWHALYIVSELSKLVLLGLLSTWGLRGQRLPT